MTDGLRVMDGEPWLALLAAALATYVWRAAGARLGGRLATSSAVFRWMELVSYALLAGLVARMILLPAGPLADVPAAGRLAAAVAAAGVFLATRHSILLGAAAGVAVLLAPGLLT